MPAHKLVSDEDREAIRQRFVRGDAVPQIAADFGLTPAHVRVIASRLGAKRPVSTLVTRKPHKPTAPEDIASRLAVLLGLQPRTAAPRRTIPDADLLRYAGDERAYSDATFVEWGLPWDSIASCISRIPSLDEPTDAIACRRLLGFNAFAREVIEVEPQVYQLAVGFVLLASKNAVFVLGRQSGKDWTAGLFCTWEALVSPNSRILIISEAQRQSDLLAERVMAFIARSPECFDAVTESTRERLRFTNGSELYFLPSTGAIRGLTEVTRVIANEARGIPDESFEAVSPMLARLNGSMSLFSTPMGRQGKLYEFYSNPAFAVMQLPSSVNRYLSPDFLESEKLKMDSDAYAREYLGQFSDIQGAFFSSQSIERCRKDYSFSESAEEGKVYAIGFDPARVRDSSVVTLVSRDGDGNLKVEAIRDFVNVAFQEQLGVLRWLSETFHPQIVVIEYAGLGMGPCEELERLGLPVRRFIPTVASKLEAYGHLKNAMEKGILSIPASHTKLAVELRMFQFKVTSSGAVTLHHLSGQGDDFADSLCYAVYGLKGESVEWGVVVSDW